MPKKSNLSTENKTKLKKAVLKEIGENNINDTDEISIDISNDQADLELKKKTIKKPIKKVVKKAVPAKKSIKKTTKLNSVKPKSAKKADWDFEIDEEQVEVKKEVNKKPVKKFNLYKKSTSNDNGSDWETASQSKEESLEALFSDVKKPKFLSQKSEFEGYEADSSKSNNRNKSGFGKSILSLAVKILGLLIIILVLLFAFDVFGIYRLGFNDNISYTVASSLSLPVGKVNNSKIPLARYFDDLKDLKVAIESQREGLINYANKKSAKDIIFYNLVAEKLMEEKLISYGMMVKESDVNAQIEALYQQAGGKIQAEGIIGDLYGLSLDRFKSRVLRPMLVREFLQQAVVEDASLDINLQAKNKAEEVLSMALAGANFSELAQNYSDDEATLNIGGDLGWAVKGQLDPRWEELIFSTEENSILPQLVKSGFGYHIVKVGERVENEEGMVESVRVNHILLGINVDNYIKEMIDRAEIVKYVK